MDRAAGLGRIAHSVHEFSLDHATTIGLGDVEAAMEVAARPGAVLADLYVPLGGRVLAMSKAAALHVRRVIQVDLSNDLDPDTAIRLVPGKPNVNWLVGA